VKDDVGQRMNLVSSAMQVAVYYVSERRELRLNGTLERGRRASDAVWLLYTDAIMNGLRGDAVRSWGIHEEPTRSATRAALPASYTQLNRRKINKRALLPESIMACPTLRGRQGPKS
jgi:hypothetical protein